MRWRTSLRVIDSIPVDRARVRYTLTYVVSDRLSVGVEVNPLDDDYGLLANYRVLDETHRRPALIVGTSSDRIGTTSGRAYYATFSKDLREEVGLPIAPYVGTAFGEFDDEWELIGGLRIAFTDRLSSTSLWDGHNLHHTVDYAFENGWRAGLVVVDLDGDTYLGVSVGTSF